MIVRSQGFTKYHYDMKYHYDGAQFFSIENNQVNWQTAGWRFLTLVYIHEFTRLLLADYKMKSDENDVDVGHCFVH